MGIFGRGPKKSERPVLGSEKKTHVAGAKSISPQTGAVAAAERALRLKAEESANLAIADFRKNPGLGTADMALTALDQFAGVANLAQEKKIKDMANYMIPLLTRARPELSKAGRIVELLSHDKVIVGLAVVGREDQILKDVITDYNARAMNEAAAGRREASGLFAKTAADIGKLLNPLKEHTIVLQRRYKSAESEMARREELKQIIPQVRNEVGKDIQALIAHYRR